MKKRYFFIGYLIIANIIMLCLTSCQESPKRPSSHQNTPKTSLNTSTLDSITQDVIKTKLFDQLYDEGFDIPSKFVLGKEFVYEWPRFIHKDPSGEWNITERPMNIYTYRNSFRHIPETTTSTPHSHAFKIVCINGDNIQMLNLDELNPYIDHENKKYKGHRTYFTEGQLDPPHHKSAQELIQACDFYVTNNTVIESEADYVSVIFEMAAYKEQTLMAKVKTLWLVNDKGEVILKKEALSNSLLGHTLTKDKKHFIYLLGNERYQAEYSDAEIVIDDVVNQKEIYRKTDKDQAYQYVDSQIFSFPTQAPGLDLYTFIVRYKDPERAEKCLTTNGYINFEEKEIRLSCLTQDDLENRLDHLYIYENLFTKIFSFAEFD